MTHKEAAEWLRLHADYNRNLKAIGAHQTARNLELCADLLDRSMLKPNGVTWVPEVGERVQHDEGFLFTVRAVNVYAVDTASDQWDVGELSPVPESEDPVALLRDASRALSDIRIGHMVKIRDRIDAYLATVEDK